MICDTEMATGTENKSSEDSLKDIIQSLRGDISKQFDELKHEVGKLSNDTRDLHKDVKELRHEITEIAKKQEETEERICGLEEREMISQELLCHIISEHRDMAEKIDYLENKSRQNNIRIYQMKEGAEGADMVGFITRLINEKLGIPANDLLIVAAHRSLAKKPDDAAPPRSIVVRFLQWNTRQKVLQAAWAKKDVRYEETRIYFDRDYSAKVQQERTRYVTIRKRLQEKGVKSHILYPAKLKVFVDDDYTITFETPDEAIKQLVTKGILQEPPPLADQHSSRSTSFRRVGRRVSDKTIDELISELRRKTPPRAEKK